jgi:glycosyltransferase involved in cell wall biosynthesis
MSELNSLIPPEISGDALYDLIKKLAATEPLTSVLQIGPSAGGGSTEAFVSGLAQNQGNPKLFCVEVSKVRFEKLRETYASYPFVHCYNLSSVAVTEFPNPDEVRRFYTEVDSGLRKFPLDQVLGWLEQDIAYVRDSGVEAGAVDAIKAEHGIDVFDMVLVDGSEFTGEVEYAKVRGAMLILLDDTNTFKCWRVREQLLADPMYDVIADDQTLRNGYSAFRRRATPRTASTTKCAGGAGCSLPIHFLTIVLNGEPFIRYHEKMLANLDIPWHWHVVEGVAALKHDTAWSVAGGGRVADSLHDKGLSKDGTSAYLDDLAKRFPDRVTVYRKPTGEFWDGKLEMVNAPIPNMREECLLWQMDNDELWTVEQIKAVHAAFLADPARSAAKFWCWYFVGPAKFLSTRYNYAQNPNQEWLRTWRFRPGMRWAAHEPPTLVEPILDEPGATRDVAKVNPFGHDEMERIGAVFQHFAYATEDQLAFKEVYYGYKDARSQWRALQAHKGSGLVKDYLAWVSDNTMFDDAAEPYRIDPIAKLDAATSKWSFEPDARLGDTDTLAGVAGSAEAGKGPRVVLDGIFWQYLSSGIGRVWENILREWVRSGFIDNVVVLDRAGTAPRIPGVHYWSIPRHSYSMTGLDSLNLDDVCRRLRADLFVSTYYSCTTTVPSFFSGHDMIPEMLGFPLQEETWHEKRRAILHAVGHSMVSRNSADDLEDLYPVVSQGSTYVSHNGVAPAFFRPRPDQIAAFRAKHGLAFRSYVLMVGERLGYGGYKNGGLVFKALGSMPDNKAPTLICVGGHQEIEAELRELAPRLDVRRLALNDEELRACYGGAHALVYPSRYEGFGMPPVEAMACGAPAIVCRNSSLPEVVGDAAIFVDEDDPADLVRAIDQLLEESYRTTLVANGQKQARQFTFAATASKLQAALVETHARVSGIWTKRTAAAWEEMRQLQAAEQSVRALGQDAGGSMTVAFSAGSASLLKERANLEHTLAELRSMRSSPFWKARELSVRLLQKLKLRDRG